MLSLFNSTELRQGGGESKTGESASLLDQSYSSLKEEDNQSLKDDRMPFKLKLKSIFICSCFFFLFLVGALCRLLIPYPYDKLIASEKKWAFELARWEAQLSSSVNGTI